MYRQCEFIISPACGPDIPASPHKGPIHTVRREDCLSLRQTAVLLGKAKGSLLYNVRCGHVLPDITIKFNGCCRYYFLKSKICDLKINSRPYKIGAYAGHENTYQRDYYIRHRKKLISYGTEWKRKNRKTRIGRLEHNLRGRLRKVIKRCRLGDPTTRLKTIELVGCSKSELIKHLERKFLPGMSWDNYGFHGWHIDHIVPCSAFNFEDPEQQRACFHYTNLQPLWALDNMRKGGIKKPRR